MAPGSPVSDLECGSALHSTTLQPNKQFSWLLFASAFVLTCAVGTLHPTSSLFTATTTGARQPLVISQHNLVTPLNVARLPQFQPEHSKATPKVFNSNRTPSSPISGLWPAALCVSAAGLVFWLRSLAAGGEAVALAATISAKEVQALRKETGAGMMDCKKALTENDGDLEKAAAWLRQKGIVSAGKKAGRVAAEGAVVNYIHMGSSVGVLLEVNCETDFVARGEVFQTLAKDLAMQVVACEGVTVVAPEDVDPAWLAKEREIEMGKEDLQSKPEAIRGKIVDGRMQKRVKEVALLEQPFIKDGDKTVGEVVKEAIAATGENIKVRRFVKFVLGEGLEKRADNFAEEVAAQTKMVAPAAPAPAAPTPDAPASAAPAVAVSAKAVSELRKVSGAGIMDCKKALGETNGNVDAAVEWLRQKGITKADKKAGRIAAEGAVGAYIHMGARLGVLVEVNCETDFVARGAPFKELVADLAMQCAASDVTVVSSEDVDPMWLAKEREIEMGKEDLQSKPEAIRGKIVDGRMQKRVKEVALLEQPFIKDGDKTVGEVLKGAVATIGENIRVRRFVKYSLGEGLEKRSEDFAAEVAAAAKA